VASNMCLIKILEHLLNIITKNNNKKNLQFSAQFQSSIHSLPPLYWLEMETQSCRSPRVAAGDGWKTPPPVGTWSLSLETGQNRHIH